MMTTISAAAARKDFLELVKRATSEHQVYRIQHRSGETVLLSSADYESLIETLKLLSTKGFRASLRRSFRQMQQGQTASFTEALGAED